jgi:hypothetical protein
MRECFVVRNYMKMRGLKLSNKAFGTLPLIFSPTGVLNPEDVPSKRRGALAVTSHKTFFLNVMEILKPSLPNK